jgi:hypothetical protein
VFADLEPYICTFSDCRGGITTFSSQNSWADHEFEVHRKIRRWECLYCLKKSFPTANLLREHIEFSHMGTGKWVRTSEGWGRAGVEWGRTGVDSAQQEFSPYGAPVSMLPSAEELECPFCLTFLADSIPKFVAHVGRHMQEIAIAAIPFSAHDDSDKNLQTQQGNHSELTEPGDESDESEEEALSALESLPVWISREERVTPSLRNLMEEYHLGSPLYCIGCTRKGLRCKLAIRNLNAQAFADCLKVIQESKGAADVELSQLETLARNGLCLRYHQGQAGLIAKHWQKGMISKETPVRAKRLFSMPEEKGKMHSV